MKTAKTFTKYGFFLSVLFGVVLTSAKESYSIPAFARKYKTSCTTCHTIIPARNAFGEAFRRNGYVMPVGDDALTKDEPVALGAEGWKEVFPNAVWPGLLSPSFPLAAYVHQRLVVDGGTETTYFDMPHEFELLIGGNFGESIGFFGEWVAFEKGKNAPGLKRFFIQFNDVFGAKNGFNIRLGRFEPGITDGNTDTNRMDLEHIRTLDYKTTGQWRARDAQSGIEINGILGKRTYYALGVVNGQANTYIEVADQKDVYFRLSHKFGGMSLDGIDEAGVVLKAADNWVDNSALFGAWIYRGSIDDQSYSDGSSGTYGRNFTRIGGDFKFGYERLHFISGLWKGTDNDYGMPGAADIKSTAWFMEANVMFYPWLVGFARLGGVNRDGNAYLGDEKYTVFDPNLSFLVRPNVRLTVQFHFKNVDGSDNKKFQYLKLNTLFAF